MKARIKGKRPTGAVDSAFQTNTMRVSRLELGAMLVVRCMTDEAKISHALLCAWERVFMRLQVED